MNELLVMEKRSQAVTTSKNISEQFKKNHQHVLEKIRNLDCSKEFWQSNFRPSTYKDSRGKTQSDYIVTKDGFIFLVMGFKGEKASEFKEKYISQFNKMEKFIHHKQSEEYIEARKDSKLLQKSTMDVVKDFVEYAKDNGSKSADRYYIIYNKLVNNILGIESNSLDNLDSKELLMRSKILDYISKNVSIDIKNELYYKDIYKNCKYKLESMIDFIRV